jgi:4-amino-4-deoxy-L-arabinose transferase-like glycosyltransferase
MKHRILILLALLICSYVFFFLNLGAYSLKEPDEGRYAEIPREMVERGDYLVPRLNYVRYFEKPPLLYWVTAASFKIFGIDEWSARLPNAVMAFFTVLITYACTACRFGRRTALISSLLFTSSFGFFSMARIVTTDMLFSFLLFASLVCFYWFYLEQKPVFIYLFYAALAFAVLAKGPVAIVLLGATIVLFLFFEKRLSFMKEVASPAGLALFAVIAVPWFVVMCIREKGFFDFFFVDQHILRFFTSKHKRSGPFYYFFPVLFGSLFPWSFFLPRAIGRYWKIPELRLFLIWSFLVFIFFSVSGSKLPPYILPIYPALAIVVGYLFNQEWEKGGIPRAELFFYGIVFFSFGLTGITVGTGLVGGYLTALFDSTVPLKDVRGFAILVGLTSFIILCSLLFRRIKTYRGIFFLFGLFSMAVILGLMSHVHVIDQVKTTKQIASELKKRTTATDIVVNYRSFDETLPFYLARRTYIADYRGELRMGSAYPDASPFFLNNEELRQLDRSGRKVFVVMKEKHLSRLGDLGLEMDILKRGDERVLVGNRAAVMR